MTSEAQAPEDNSNMMNGVLSDSFEEHRVSGSSSLKVMTFNIWLSGRTVSNGLHKIARHIQRNEPDIVAIQEVFADDTEELAKLLGDKWKGVAHNRHNPPDVAILTPHTILSGSSRTTEKAIGAKIFVPHLNKTFSFWSLHLDFREYGPYAANREGVTNPADVMAGEMITAGRMENARELLDSEWFREALQLTDSEPLLVCGDLNSPSHLDWTNSANHLHNGWAIDWPVTTMFEVEAQLIDSYREIHPNPVVSPGTTWSTVEKRLLDTIGKPLTDSEPQDRIDFVFYRGKSLRPIHSYTYQGTEPVAATSDHKANDYPSDHFAVVTTFAVS